MISWPFMVTELGSLSNYDDDHNDDFKKNNRFNDQNNSSALASCFLVHFFDVHCTITTWNLLICRFIEDVDMRRRFFFLFLNQNKILKNSTPGKVACIWHNERVQIDAIKFERTQIHFFLPTFSLPSSSSLLKVPNWLLTDIWGALLRSAPGYDYNMKREKHHFTLRERKILQWFSILSIQTRALIMLLWEAGSAFLGLLLIRWRKFIPQPTIETPE